jgi:hypothetical protein
MLFSSSTHMILIAIGLLATPILGFTFRKQRALLVPMLFAIPICLGLAGGDLIVGVLAEIWPARVMDGGPWDWAAFAMAAFSCFCAAELLTQRFITAMTGAGARYTTREDAAAEG